MHKRVNTNILFGAERKIPEYQNSSLYHGYGEVLGAGKMNAIEPMQDCQPDE